MQVLLSMAAFALAASISPGPVNIVALGSGASHGFTASLRHVSGATVGFTVLLLLTGLGLNELLAGWPAASRLLQWGGIAFLLYLAWKLASDNGELGQNQQRCPSFRHGAIMQWLNPKAWLAALAGMGAYASDGNHSLIWQFAAIYFVICYLSIACWAYAGARLQHLLRHPARMRLFNRLLALLLAGSTLYLL
ncbi:LysE family translocator [Pseudogulbenkiania ferrooxidans]|uniref:Lysine exporter protein (LYSE/YGGA) n=1 Tax=Pseudogulbenkiania ferrooxidans 2002 TaxID=279714 RepID=B9Z6V8_9NEIS|nr:LysE family translocator [Pseudogulbenkiania ferrooxidans]EEG07273.1 Lysine exporter protein (LYSE/YGGA) [Pseudogulbenkiania ferrooxidans 2002]